MNFEDLKGKILSDVRVDDDEIFFETTDGKHYKMYHPQDCCEAVYIESIVGNLRDLVGKEILEAEEVTSDEHPEDYKKEGYEECFMWTFYKLRTLWDSVTIRWFGSSEYYSVSVSFIEV